MKPRDSALEAERFKINSCNKNNLEHIFDSPMIYIIYITTTTRARATLLLLP